MKTHGLLVAVAALALTACNNRSAGEQVGDAANAAAETADSTANAAGGAMDAAGSAMGNAGAAIGNAGDGVLPAGATATPTAAEFVQKAAISDLYEITASKLAQQKSKSTAVTKFAGEMIAAHTATTAKLKTITAGDAALKPPAALDADHQKLIADLKAARPNDFDTLYVDQQTASHKDALALMQSYASAGDNAKLKAFATKTAPKVQHHLDMVQQIDHSGVPDNMAGNAGGQP